MRINRTRALVFLAVATSVVVSLQQIRILLFTANSSTQAAASEVSLQILLPPIRETCAPGDDFLLDFASSSPHNTTNTTRNRRIFTCGWGNGNFLANSVFPEFDGPYQWTAATPSSPHDILLFGAHGPCEGKTPGRASGFQGKTLYNNGESFGDPRDGGSCDFVLGPIADSSTSLRVPFVTLLMGGMYRPHQSKVFDIGQKANNTREFYMLYAASNCVRFRDDAAESFGRVGNQPLHLGGRCPLNHHKRRRIGVEAPNKSIHNDWGGNAKFYHRYRFALVLENHKMDGYITEKILNAFLAGSIPIWYGTSEIFDIFNERAFIYYDDANPTQALELVANLEDNRTLYDEMLSQPILAHGNHTIEKYFSFEGDGTIKKRIRNMLRLER